MRNRIIPLVITLCYISCNNNSEYSAIVDTSGNGDYISVQAAVDAAPENRTSPWSIFIKNGSYKETVHIPHNKPFIHLIGQDKEKTIIHEKLHVGTLPSPDSRWFKNDSAAWPFSVHNPQSPVYGMQESVVRVDATDFYAENISFVNDFGVDAQTGPQALAIRLNNDRAAFYNCMFRSFQDTWMTSTNDADRLYAKNCFIEGAVDYFYGGGDALLDECTFYNVRSNSVIVAPKQSTAKYGYVFRNCIVDGNSAAADGKQKLGRPWHNAPKAIFINTTMRIPIDPEGWDDMGSVPALFAEYESRDINGNLLDLVNRKTFYEGRDGVSGTSRTTITKEEADQMVYENIIAGADGWNPRCLIK